MGKRVVIAGANGFIGRNLQEKLKSENIEYICLSSKDIEGYIQTSYSIKELDEIILDNDVIVNLAFERRNFENIKNYEKSIEINENLVNVIRLKENVRYIFSSSISIYGENKLPFDEEMTLNTKNFYSKSKDICENYIIEELEEYLILRFAHVFGANEDNGYFINKMMKNAFYNLDLRVNIEAIGKREFIYVKDAANAIYFCIENQNCGVFNVGSGAALDNIELSKLIYDVFKSRSKIEYFSDNREITKDSYMTSKKFNDLGFRCEYSIEEALIDIKKEMI